MTVTTQIKRQRMELPYWIVRKEDHHIANLPFFSATVIGARLGLHQ